MTDSTISRMAELSPKKRALLEQWRAEQRRAQPQVLPLQRRARSGPARLSFGQERLWFLDQLEPGNPAYNVSEAVWGKGELNVGAWLIALESLSQRHEVLRTRFVVEQGVPMQVVDPPQEAMLCCVDLSSINPEIAMEIATQIVRENALVSFDLTKGPLFRTMLVRVSPAAFALSIEAHHIVCDGWSASIIREELVHAYESVCVGRVPNTATLQIQYADYAEWQREWMCGELLKAQLAFWKEQIGDLPFVLELPVDFSRPSQQNYAGATCGVNLSPELGGQLRELSRREDSTLFMTMLAGFEVLLSRYTGQERFAVGTTIANRSRKGLERLAGFLVNTLVLRGDVSGDPSFLALLKRVKAGALAAYSNQDLPFEKLVEELQPKRDPGFTPLFQVMFELQSTVQISPGRALVPAKGFELKTINLTPQTSKFDLTVTIIDGPVMKIVFEYSTVLFAPRTIQEMMEHYIFLLRQVVSRPTSRISKFLVMTGEELSRFAELEREYQWRSPSSDLMSQVIESGR